VAVPDAGSVVVVGVPVAVGVVVVGVVAGVVGVATGVVVVGVVGVVVGTAVVAVGVVVSVVVVVDADEAAAGAPAVIAPDSSRWAASAASFAPASTYPIELGSGAIIPSLLARVCTRSLEAPAAAICPSRAEFCRWRTSVWRVVLLEVALTLSVKTLRATMPTRRVVRRPIHIRPRVRRWTRPDSASPETAPAVVPTASGTSRAGIGVPA